MIGYVTLGTRDIKKAAGFYDTLLAELGAKRVMDYDRFVAWSRKPGTPMLSVTYPFDGNPATVGNGVMIALAARDKAQVDRLYTIAMENGATDEGKPGPRMDGFYAAYFRDLDGNKLNAFFMG